MRLEDFSFELPEELIAQAPLTDRQASRLMVVDRARQTIEHCNFTDLPEFLGQGDLLVRNETRVIPARLFGQKQSGGQIEVLLVQRHAGDDEVWTCLTRSSKPVRVGAKLIFPEQVTAEVLAIDNEGRRMLRFDADGDFQAKVDSFGRMPLPPYIRREDTTSDRERYQTVFARHAGAVAAPTAGLHFTEEMFARLQTAGVDVCGLTLHVGLGTFQPIRVANLLDHKMHGEVYEISPGVAEAIQLTRLKKNRVVALGTTTTRTLEYAVDAQGCVTPGCGVTDLFIYPGFRFRVVDSLITNFHLPKSTLLMLVSAFAGRDLILEAYRQAVAEKYRFFSYGDCMLII